MKYFKIFTLLISISSNFLYSNDIICDSNNADTINYKLLNTCAFVSPNIINLCSDLCHQGYDIKDMPNDNICIYTHNKKLMEIPLECYQPTLQECLKWSGTQFTNTQDNDTITDLYFNILGFKDRKYTNIFETNSNYKDIKFAPMKYSYPLFEIQGTKEFQTQMRQCLRNIIYTDAGKLLMYRLFLASNYLTSTDEIMNDYNLNLFHYLGNDIVIKYPINIIEHESSRYFRHDNNIGINMEYVKLYCENTKNTNKNFIQFELTSRPVETSIYHELVHCFHHLYSHQLIYNEQENKFLYLSDSNISVKQAFNIFCEYNNIDTKKAFNKKTVKNIFNSLMLYQGNHNAITSNEEFTTTMGIYPNSKYYYNGAELSENLFRFYLKLPLRDSHIHFIQSPYNQDANFINNIKSSIGKLNLHYSNIKLYEPININIEETSKSQVITIDSSSYEKYEKDFKKGYNNCHYTTKSEQLKNNIDDISNIIDSYPRKNKLSIGDVYSIINILYPE